MLSTPLRAPTVTVPLSGLLNLRGVKSNRWREGGGAAHEVPFSQFRYLGQFLS